jgi:16S rRNA (guanine1207-N2)-methyltransferase
MSGRQYFDTDPAVDSRPTTVTLGPPDGPVELLADRGVFSITRVDAGTAALLRSVPAAPPDGDVLDLGCGYGPIAVALARRNPRTTVWALDVNRRAVDLTATNAARLGLTNVRAVTPEDVPDGMEFAEVWSNPPVRIGKPALRELLERWLVRLVPAGRALLVAHRHLGADSLAAWLEGSDQREDGQWAVRRVASKSGYRVLELRRR